VADKFQSAWGSMAAALDLGSPGPGVVMAPDVSFCVFEVLWLAPLGHRGRGFRDGGGGILLHGGWPGWAWCGGSRDPTPSSSDGAPVDDEFWATWQPVKTEPTSRL
jgi:hypothetical protein